MKCDMVVLMNTLNLIVGLFFNDQVVGITTLLKLFDAVRELLNVLIQSSLCTLILGFKLLYLGSGLVVLVGLALKRLGELGLFLVPSKLGNLSVGQLIGLLVKLGLQALVVLLVLALTEDTVHLKDGPRHAVSFSLSMQSAVQGADLFIFHDLPLSQKLMVDEVERLPPLEALLNKMTGVESSFAGMVSFELDICDLLDLELKSRLFILPQNMNIGVEALGFNLILDSCISLTFGGAAVFHRLILTISGILAISQGLSQNFIKVGLFLLQSLQVVVQLRVCGIENKDVLFSFTKQLGLDLQVALMVRAEHGKLGKLLRELNIFLPEPFVFPFQIFGLLSPGIRFYLGNALTFAGLACLLLGEGKLSSQPDNPILKLSDIPAMSLNLPVTDDQQLACNLGFGFLSVTLLGELDHPEAGLAQLTVGNLQLALNFNAALLSGLKLGNGNGLVMFSGIQFCDDCGKLLEQFVALGEGDVKV
ncbi:hypothetical protein N7454_003852 [Penicillium verhagenii]|nr:hypothetical protein N7454_003852 [Penicillium verhagenii]